MCLLSPNPLLKPCLAQRRLPLRFQGTRFTSYPGTTITRRGGWPANHFLAMSLASASRAKVALE